MQDNKQLSHNSKSSKLQAFHPLAKKYGGDINKNELEALAKSIKEKGQDHPIIVHEGKIIDGIQRYRACLRAKIEPRPVRSDPGTALGRMLKTKQAVHIPDITADQGYIDRHPLFVTAVELGGFRAMLCVPMLKDNDVIGSINIYRQEAQPFSDKQIALLALVLRARRSSPSRMRACSTSCASARVI